MEEAEISNQVAIMDGGKIVAKGTPYELKSKYTKDTAYITMKASEAFENDLNKLKLAFVRKKNFYKMDVEDIKSFLDLVATYKGSIDDIEIKKGTLNDVFLTITGKSIREEVA